MTNEGIFDRAETHGWMDDFGRWNFKDDGLIKFALEIKTAEWVGLTDDEVFNIYKQFDSLQYKSFAKAIEAKLKEKNA
jgi:hypothetical protein